MLERPADPITQAADLIRRQLDEMVKVTRAAVDRVGEVESERDEAREAVKTRNEEDAYERAELIAVLADVKYWMHDAYSLNRPVSDPRPLLRRIEWLLDDVEPAVCKVEKES